MISSWPPHTTFFMLLGEREKIALQLVSHGGINISFPSEITELWLEDVLLGCKSMMEQSVTGKYFLGKGFEVRSIFHFHLESPRCDCATRRQFGKVWQR